jgi:hypothetical protein
MHDAVVLANCIYAMKDGSYSSITSTFEDYYGQRYHRLDAQFKRSQSMSAITAGQVRGPSLATIALASLALEQRLTLHYHFSNRNGRNGYCAM